MSISKLGINNQCHTKSHFSIRHDYFRSLEDGMILFYYRLKNIVALVLPEISFLLQYILIMNETSINKAYLLLDYQ